MNDCSARVLIEKGQGSDTLNASLRNLNTLDLTSHPKSNSSCRSLNVADLSNVQKPPLQRCDSTESTRSRRQSPLETLGKLMKDSSGKSLTGAGGAVNAERNAERRAARRRLRRGSSGTSVKSLNNLMDDKSDKSLQRRIGKSGSSIRSLNALCDDNSERSIQRSLGASSRSLARFIGTDEAGGPRRRPRMNRRVSKNMEGTPPASAVAA